MRRANAVPLEKVEGGMEEKTNWAENRLTILTLAA